MTTRNGAGLTLLCDADGCLFPSEEPAHDVSAEVMTRFLAEVGITSHYSADQLRQEFTGLNFRATATELAQRSGIALTGEVLEHWVRLERDVVMHHLADVLRPDAAVIDPLTRLSRTAQLGVVSSSALERVDVSLRATDLAPLFPGPHRYSAESLRTPVSKPHPAVYMAALRGLGVRAEDAIAVEDSTVGVRAAVAAEIPVLGLVQFVSETEKSARTAELLAAGARTTLLSWDEVAEEAAGVIGRSRMPSGG